MGIFKILILFGVGTFLLVLGAFFVIGLTALVDFFKRQ